MNRIKQVTNGILPKIRYSQIVNTVGALNIFIGLFTLISFHSVAFALTVGDIAFLLMDSVMIANLSLIFSAYLLFYLYVYRVVTSLVKIALNVYGKATPEEKSRAEAKYSVFF